MCVCKRAECKMSCARDIASISPRAIRDRSASHRIFLCLLSSSFSDPFHLSSLIISIHGIPYVICVGASRKISRRLRNCFCHDKFFYSVARHDKNSTLITSYRNGFQFLSFPEQSSRLFLLKTSITRTVDSFLVLIIIM